MKRMIVSLALSLIATAAAAAPNEDALLAVRAYHVSPTGEATQTVKWVGVVSNKPLSLSLDMGEGEPRIPVVIAYASDGTLDVRFEGSVGIAAKEHYAVTISTDAPHQTVHVGERLTYDGVGAEANGQPHPVTQRLGRPL